ncbi:phosphatidylglycerophosphatase A family protein [Oceanomicrobium pacificus]|uniref:Phosphatidylglycerophosphatase A n=1 Tax=Oceanomicrobium pacificus TaxID=2692916 RepID=A0A6B0TW29_9RHOB|nr:phosphatidylglycerophosphatase A [Oceanomicrobium pacificus]MXU65768.1 phosphatidylglycerophosphatase A [Oceanomicrobium pacificus]
MIRIITSFFGAGLLPGAPGTWGSMAAIPAAMLLHYLGGFPALSAATLLVFFLGWWATSRHVVAMGESDPSEIVIDEVVGMWIGLMPLSFGLWRMGAEPHVFPWPGWVLAFLLFRFFDVLKPFPVSWADRLHSPLGVMLDDVIAGIMAAAIVMLAAAVAHGWGG